MDKLYLHEKRPDGEISAIGLYYSHEEAESVIKQLRELPEKKDCEYTISKLPQRPSRAR